MDFYCSKLKLAIELDGGQHVENDSREYDAARSAYLKSHGIEVMRFWNHEILQKTDSVLDMIAQKITPPSLPTACLPDRQGQAGPFTSRGVTEEEKKMSDPVLREDFIDVALIEKTKEVKGKSVSAKDYFAKRRSIDIDSVDRMFELHNRLKK